MELLAHSFYFLAFSWICLLCFFRTGWSGTAYPLEWPARPSSVASMCLQRWASILEHSSSATKLSLVPAQNPSHSLCCLWFTPGARMARPSGTSHSASCLTCRTIIACYWTYSFLGHLRWGWVPLICRNSWDPPLIASIGLPAPSL